jgi:hypothetical protein
MPEKYQVLRWKCIRYLHPAKLAAICEGSNEVESLFGQQRKVLSTFGLLCGPTLPAMLSLLHKISVRNFLIFSFCLLSAFLYLDGNWRKSRFPIQMDANGYYVYLPAIFIYQDLEHLGFVNQMPEQFDRKYFLYPSARGGYMTKYSPGVAILEAPFFLVAHALAPALGYEASGYSPPYRLAVAIAGLFYSCLGIWILSLVLARYFRHETVLLTAALLLFGTMFLFYILFQPALTHNFVFVALALELWFLERWIRSQSITDLFGAGACTGFATLIRPTEVLIGLVLLGYVLALRPKGKNLFAYLISQIGPLLGAAAGFVLFILPVFAYWKYATGNWVAYTYSDEGFYFDRPWQIWYGLFGFRKGWFIYTPMLFLAAWGMWGLVKSQQFRPFVQGLLWYLPFNLFIVLSWYGWWYGGCFGNRALVPALALAAYPLAWLLENSRKPLLTYALAGFFVLLNAFQSFQYQRQILHMDGMTWRAYFYIFGKWQLKPEEKAHLQTLLDLPDYGERGKKLDEYFK